MVWYAGKCVKLNTLYGFRPFRTHDTRKYSICLCRKTQYSFETKYAKSLKSGSLDKFSTEVESGWLWELSAKTTKRKLDHERVRPKKSLGQNFVTDGDLLRKIAFETGIRPGEPVIEFGPGTGNLTRHLLELGANVTAIEKDDVLQAKLKNEFQNESNLHIVHSDVMRINFKELVSDILGKFENYTRIKVVSNLPYNITTDCLKLYLPMGDLISNLIFMIQDEVAKRLCQKTAGYSDYRVMTVYTHHFSDPQYVLKIRKEAYYPQPLVDGALVNFQLKPSDQRSLQSDETSFISFVNKAFSSRRKLLKNSLEPFYDGNKVVETLESLKMPDNIRSQELTYEQYLTLYAALKQSD